MVGHNPVLFFIQCNDISSDSIRILHVGEFCDNCNVGYVDTIVIIMVTVDHCLFSIQCLTCC